MVNSGAHFSNPFLPLPVCGTDIGSKPRRLCIYTCSKNCFLQAMQMDLSVLPKPNACSGHNLQQRQQTFNNYRNCIVSFKGTPIISVMGLSTDSSKILVLMVRGSKGHLKYPHI